MPKHVTIPSVDAEQSIAMLVPRDKRMRLYITTAQAAALVVGGLASEDGVTYPIRLPILNSSRYWKTLERFLKNIQQ